MFLEKLFVSAFIMSLKTEKGPFPNMNAKNNIFNAITIVLGLMTS